MSDVHAPLANAWPEAGEVPPPPQGTAVRDDPAAPAAAGPEAGRGSSLAAVRKALSFQNISAVYIFIALFVIFSFWVPQTFLTAGVWKTLIDDQALTVLVAIGLLVPLSAGAFNLAVGAEVGFGGILVAWLLADHGVATVPAIALTLIAGALIGTTSGLLIVRARIDSFIATLGISSVLAALTAWVSGSQQILNLPAGFQAIATNQLLDLAYPVWIAVVVALAAWYALERTPAGRRVYATGGNISAARLAGVRTSLVILLSLITCGVLAASAGVLESSSLGTGDPTAGPSFLLPAFAAVFLGSTQFRGGRYNIGGTILAVYTLAEGVKGLQLAGAPVWLPSLFNGVALLLAVGLASYQGTARRAQAIRRALRMRGKPAAVAGEQPPSLPDLVRPYMNRLHAELGETVDLATLDGGKARLIDRVGGLAPHRAVPAYGEEFPLHCTATGKALLATLTDAQIEQLLPDELEQLTAQTITSRGQLIADLAMVRRQGIAFEREEHTEGICAVSSVVEDGRGQLAAISIRVPAQRFAEDEKRLAQLLAEVGAACSGALG